MPTFLLTYVGDAAQPESQEDGAAVMAAWVAWFTEVGDGVVDGGNPTGPSVTVAADGSIREGSASGVSGYSVLRADSLAAAADLAQHCPHLAAGGRVEVHEIFDVM